LGRIIKALILGWIGKKIYDRVTDDSEETAQSGKKRARSAASARPSSARHSSRKPSSRAA